MRNSELLAGAALFALFIASPALADPKINQTATNSGSVTPTTGGVLVGDNISGVAGSASISANGSAASVSVLGVNTDFVSPGTFGSITQDSSNTGSVSITQTPGASLTINGAVTGRGAAASISGVGAISAVAITGIDHDGFSQQTTGNITQDTDNTSSVLNGGWPGSGNSLSVGGVRGNGASASISTTAAASSVGATFINSSGDVSIAASGRVKQETTHNAGANKVQVVGAIKDLTDAEGGIQGLGASAAVSATGAASSVSVAYIASEGQAEIGNVNQTTINNSSSSVINNSSTLRGVVHDGFTVKGNGASASLSATGAVSSASLTSINSDMDGQQTFGNISQVTRTNNASLVRNAGQISDILGVSGTGASASISATGAASAVSLTNISGSGGNPSTDVGNVSQTTGIGSFDVENYARIDTRSLASGITGDAASVSASATGAISSVSATYVNTEGKSSTEFGNVTQTTSTGAGTIENAARIENTAAAKITGDGASAAISAAGAVSSMSATFINSTEIAAFDVGNIKQVSTNNADVANEHLAPLAGGSPNLNLGVLSGDAASASVSNTGSIASVSLTSVNNKAASGAPSILAGTVNQRAVNNGVITNTGGTITTGTISGTGASASIAANGAAASVSIASINDIQPLGPVTIGNVTQTAINAGNVTNAGSITAGGIAGKGASVSISATGAAAGVSFSAIK